MTNSTNHQNLKQTALTLTTTQHTDIRGDIEGWQNMPHQFSKEQIGAAQAAIFTGRPLLVRGDPGLGKSQLAAALATVLNLTFDSITINGDTDISELLYQVDHVKRLSDSQVADEAKGDLHLAHYINPGILWRSLAPNTRLGLDENGNVELKESTESTSPKGHLVLIDEIDKASTQLPNALLEVLSSQCIGVPVVNAKVPRAQDNPVVVVITSNDDKALPPAFLRRCAVLDLTLPKDKGDGIARLLEIYKVHKNRLTALSAEQALPAEFKDKAEAVAGWVMDNREKARASDDYIPGTSEFLDMLSALLQFPAEQREMQESLLKQVLIDKHSQRAS